MTRDVLVTIAGFQFMDAEDRERQDDPIEIIAPAEYFYKNGKHHILYKEVAEGFTGHTENHIKISGEESVQIRKSGLVNSTMTFEKARSYPTSYQTPFGELMLGVTARNIQVDEEEDRLLTRINYELDMNDELLAECEISILVQSRGVAEV